jgi:hypothetical protein
MRPVYCLIPVDGDRRTATKWKVGQLGDGGIWTAVTDELDKASAEREEKFLRAQAKKAKDASRRRS